jgi:hypothetical protein
MSEQTAQDYINRQKRREIEEFDNPIVKRQKEIDFWWEINLARQAEARQRRTEIPERGDYSPVARLDRELDDAQEQADRAYVRRHFNR